LENIFINKPCSKTKIIKVEAEEVVEAKMEEMGGEEEEVIMMMKMDVEV
jgi:hypothetical protein